MVRAVLTSRSVTSSASSFLQIWLSLDPSYDEFGFGSRYGCSQGVNNLTLAPFIVLTTISTDLSLQNYKI
jgi:hypothetical protein